MRDNPAAYTVGSGQLTLTLETGDIYTGDTNPPPNNFILQSADHAGADWVIETKLSGNMTDGYGQGGLIAYGNGDNYVKLDAISDPGQTRINRIEFRSEVAGVIAEPAAAARPMPAGTSNIWLRLSKTGTNYKGEYSFDGTAWTAFRSGGRTRWPRPRSACSASARRRRRSATGVVRLLHPRRQDAPAGATAPARATSSTARWTRRSATRSCGPTTRRCPSPAGS